MHLHKKQSSYKSLYGIIAAFVIPIVLAHILFHSGYGRQNPKSKGTLISPPISIHHQPQTYWKIASLALNNDDHIIQETLKKRWIALGKDQKRVHLTILTADTSKTSTDKDWTIELLPQTLLATLSKIKSKNHHACKLFIIDPESRVILCYDHLNKLRDIDLDLRKLLKSSRI